MSKGTYDWSTTADNNDDADASINWLEGQSAASVNNSARAMMARFAQWLKEYGGTCTVGGTADAVTLTTSTTYTGFATGIRLMFIPGADNTGAATLNVDTVGVKKLRKISSGADTALSAGDIKDGLPCEIVYDAAADSASGAWIVMNPQSTGSYPKPAGHLFGLTLSNNGSDATNDIDIATGTARDGADSDNLVLASALTKQLDAAWAVGTNAGGLDTGSIANTTYHVWLIKRPDTGVVDVLFSTSASSPTMPTNYTLKRRIGSILRESAAIVAFTQSGDLFERSVPVRDVAAASQSTTAVLRTLSVPLGINVESITSQRASSTSTSIAAGLLVTDPAQADTAPDASINTLLLQTLSTTGTYVASGQVRCRTNTSGQIRTRGSNNLTLDITTHGWVDNRGRLA